MSLVAIMLTRDDLDALPDDGLRHELIDGAFVMTPPPGLPHQSMLGELYFALVNACKDTGLKVLLAPFAVALGQNVVEPDLVVAPKEAFTQRDLPTAPLLAVEVRSASTGWLDEGRKRTLYEEYGVASYWLVDPARPSITVLGLVEGRYVQTAMTVGDQTIEVTAPFPMTLNPAELAQF
jgi:Uma2 family endonuclease